MIHIYTNKASFVFQALFFAFMVCLIEILDLYYQVVVP